MNREANYEVAQALKKQRLVLRSAALREALAEDGQPLFPLFATADKVADGARWLRDRPGVVAGATAALFVLRPRFLLRWGRRAFFAWRTLRTLQHRNP
jgi:hypothetical protein